MILNVHEIRKLFLTWASCNGFTLPTYQLWCFIRNISTQCGRDLKCSKSFQWWCTSQPFFRFYIFTFSSSLSTLKMKFVCLKTSSNLAMDQNEVPISCLNSNIFRIPWKSTHTSKSHVSETHTFSWLNITRLNILLLSSCSTSTRMYPWEYVFQYRTACTRY